MRKFFLIFIIFSFLILSFVDAAQLNSCSFKSSCSSGEVLLFKASGNTNAHAELASQNNYQTLVCCTGSNLMNTCQANGATVLVLSSITNAHVEENSMGNYNQKACLSTNDGTSASCLYATDCNSLGSTYKCVAEISSITNAHVGDCSSPYSTKVCCSVPGPIASGISQIHLSVNPDTLQIGGNTAAVRATVCINNDLDINCVANGNGAPDGTVVNFNIANIVPIGANIGSLSSGSAQTVNGIATVTFTSGNQPGSGDIHAIAGSVNRLKTITVTLQSSCVISNVEIRDTTVQGNIIPSGQVVLAGTDVKFRFTANNCVGKNVNYQIWEMDNIVPGPATEENDVSVFTSPPPLVTINQNPQTIDRIWTVQHRFDLGDAIEDGAGGDLEWEYAFKAVVDGNAVRSTNYIQLPPYSTQCRIVQAHIIHPTDDNYVYPDGETLNKDQNVRLRVYTQGNCGSKRLKLEIFDFNENAGVKDSSQYITGLAPINLDNGNQEYLATWRTEYRTGDVAPEDEDIEYTFTATVMEDSSITRDADNWIQVNDEAKPNCGNGIIQASENEECDCGPDGDCLNPPGDDLNGKQCTGINHVPPFTGGQLDCYDAGYSSQQCEFDTSQCTTGGGGGPGNPVCGDGDVEGDEGCDPPGSYCSNTNYLVCNSNCKRCIGLDGNTKTILTRTPCRDDGNGDNVGVYDETIVQVNIITNQAIPGTQRTTPKECTLISEVDIPFFTPLNVLMVLALISIYYFFVKTKNKKRIRKV